MAVDLDHLEKLAEWIEGLWIDEDGRQGATALVRAAIAELAELRSRPVVPPWTRERPTEPGFYFARFEDVLTVIAFRHSPGFGLVGPTFGGRDDVEYSGPLPMPPEPEPKGVEPCQP